LNLQAHDGLASIIIIPVPCWNQLEYTRFGLPALVRHTRPPREVIVIDNGTTDGTGIDLAGVQYVAPVRVTVVGKAQNLGFPAAINQGLNVARGDYLVLLNNDSVVTDGWLNQLIALAEMDSDVTTKHTKDTKGEKGGGDGDRPGWFGVELCLAAAIGGARGSVAVVAGSLSPSGSGRSLYVNTEGLTRCRQGRSEIGKRPRKCGFALVGVRAGEYISSIRPGMRRLVITPPE